MCHSGDDDDTEGEDVQLVVVSWRILQSLWSHECQYTFDRRLPVEGGSSAHPKVGHFGHKSDLVQQDIVGTQVVMNERELPAMEIGESLGT